MTDSVFEIFSACILLCLEFGLFYPLWNNWTSIRSFSSRQYNCITMLIHTRRDMRFFPYYMSSRFPRQGTQNVVLYLDGTVYVVWSHPMWHWLWSNGSIDM